MTLIGFAAGSLPLSLWLGRLALGVDIRDFGPDRNPGAGNVWRAGGPVLGIAAVATVMFGVACLGLLTCTNRAELREAPHPQLRSR